VSHGTTTNGLVDIQSKSPKKVKRIIFVIEGTVQI
jgi:hypothetical protein